MSYEMLERQIRALPETAQLEVERFVVRLAAGRERNSAEQNRTHEENVELVDSLIGQSHAWDGVDILEYQRQLRGEYRENA